MTSGRAGEVGASGYFAAVLFVVCFGRVRRAGFADSSRRCRREPGD